MKKADLDLHAPMSRAPQTTPPSSPRKSRPLPLTMDLPDVTPEQARQELERLLGRPDAVGQMFRKPAVWPPNPGQMSPRSREEVLSMRQARAEYEADLKAGRAPTLELELEDGSKLRKGERVRD